MKHVEKLVLFMLGDKDGALRLERWWIVFFVPIYCSLNNGIFNNKINKYSETNSFFNGMACQQLQNGLFWPTKTRRSRRKVKKKELNKTQVINTSHKLQNGGHVYQKSECIQNHYV